eukprot:m.481814 g.481814  ORF g.481814 m.481814 type:complete len:641 (+) comp22335_c0_seq1:310-2232(+)
MDVHHGRLEQRGPWAGGVRGTMAACASASAVVRDLVDRADRHQHPRSQRHEHHRLSEIVEAEEKPMGRADGSDHVRADAPRTDPPAALLPAPRRARSAQARLRCDQNCQARHAGTDRDLEGSRAYSVARGLDDLGYGDGSTYDEGRHNRGHAHRPHSDGKGDGNGDGAGGLLRPPSPRSGRGASPSAVRRISRSLQSLLFQRKASRVTPSDSTGSLDSVASDDSCYHQAPQKRQGKRRRTSQIQAVSVVTAVCPHGHEVRTVGWGSRSQSVVCRCAPRSVGLDGLRTPTGLDTDGSSSDSDHHSIGATSVISDGRHMGPLHLAAVSGDRAAVRSLLAKGNMHVDLPDADGVTPFMLSVLAGQFKCAERLLRSGAQQDRTDKHGRTVMHWVVYNGLRKALIWLLKRGADWRVADNAGRTPLHWATDSSDSRCLSVLLKRTPVSYLNEQDDQGMTALCWAAHHGHVDQVRMLLRRGANAEQCNQTGKTAVHFAVCNAEPDCTVALLRAHPSAIAERDEEGRTPLHIVCSHGSLATARVLMAAYQQAATTSHGIDYACPVQCWDNQGRTPLHCAAVTGRTRIAQELIVRGHDPECVDTNNHMPIWYARVKSHADTVGVIAKAMVDWHASRQAPISHLEATTNV